MKIINEVNHEFWCFECQQGSVLKMEKAKNIIGLNLDDIKEDKFYIYGVKREEKLWGIENKYKVLVECETQGRSRTELSQIRKRKVI